MSKISAIIVDDEHLARENLRLLLNEFCPEIEIVGAGQNVEEARKLIAEKKPEAVFLDIRMPSGEEGLDLLEDVKHNNFQIVHFGSDSPLYGRRLGIPRHRIKLVDHLR